MKFHIEVEISGPDLPPIERFAAELQEQMDTLTIPDALGNTRENGADDLQWTVTVPTF